MKVKMVSNPITPYGSFSVGQVIGSDKYPEAFLRHLVEDAHAAEWYEVKVTSTPENKASEREKKSNVSSSPVGRRSQRKTLKGVRGNS